MGNHQATNASALVIQHPNGTTERIYRSMSAGEVMQMNPGHYVSLIMPLPSSINDQHNYSADDQAVVSFTRVKLLRAHESLDLGRAYRLVTTQEVMNVIRAKKKGNMKKNHHVTIRRVEEESGNFGNDGERQRSAKSTVQRSKSWRPSLHSISEAGL